MKDVIDIALSQYGISEVPGGESNPEVLKYFDATSYEGQNWITDETAWCSAFVNWVCDKAGYEITGELNARSWLNIGYQVASPERGDIVVLWRESKDSWKGHVAFFINETKEGLWLLGGNQGNRVSIICYPKERLLEYRRLNKTLEI